jgi:beta-xylosidase
VRTYTNPVWPSYFADPAVSRFGERYYVYGTTLRDRGTVDALTSRNLVDWEPLGQVLEPVAGEGPCYWAPEVAFADGAYWLYFSVGGAAGEGHRVRVATADRPEGPFHDTGTVLVPAQDFSIDAHPFRDEDGTWWLYYCRDFLEGDRVGTGIEVDRLLDMRTLAGEPRVAVRPHADWNLFEAGRRWRGRVQDWYTVEGPFVRRRDGRYWLFFSGGAWPKPGYGLGCAVADHPAGPYVTTRTAHGPDLLRTVPGKVVGPGHGSLATGPDGRTDYLVYHAWDATQTARLMRVDRLDWTPDGPVTDGPTLEPRPVPGG